MSRRTTIFALLAALALAAPAAAQNAGDEQYRDPLGGSEDQSDSNSGSGNSGSGNSGSNSGSSGGGSGSAGQTQAAPSQSAADTPADDTNAGAGSGELARTGLDARVVLAFGLVLLLAGAGLLRVTRRA